MTLSLTHLVTHPLTHSLTQLFTGSAFGWKATAIGKNYVNAKNFLERRYNDEMELDDAVHVALLTLRESFEGEMTGTYSFTHSFTYLLTRSFRV
jgi:hypothetical protein